MAATVPSHPSAPTLSQHHHRLRLFLLYNQRPSAEVEDRRSATTTDRRRRRRHVCVAREPRATFGRAVATYGCGSVP